MLPAIEKITKNEQAHLVLTGLVAFLIPFNSRLTVVCIVLLTLNWLFSGKFQQNRTQLVQVIPMTLLGFFFLHVVGIFFSENTTEALKDVESKLSFLVFPLLYFTFPIKKTSHQDKILESFAIGSLLAAFICIGYALWQYLQTGMHGVFFYTKLGLPLSSHPAYFSVYVLFSFFIILKFSVANWQEYTFSRKASIVGMLIFCLLFIALLSSRTALLSCILLSGMTLFVYASARKGFTFATVATLLLLILISVAGMSLPVTKDRVTRLISSLNNDDGKRNIRLQIWDAAIIVVKESPVFGHGTGDVQEKLMPAYAATKSTLSLQSNFNAHNQYLQSWIATGISGLFLLLLLVFYPLYIAVRRRSFLSMVFFAIFLLAMLTESYLEREQGVIFCIFFTCFLGSSSLALPKKNAD